MGAKVSAKPATNRDYFLARIARALGCAGYSVEECDAIMAWVQDSKPAGTRTCAACGGHGRLPEPDVGPMLLSALDSVPGDQVAMFLQGICLACRGDGKSG